MLRNSFIFFTPIAALVLQSCATLVSTSEYEVALNTDPPGARYKVRQADGNLLYQGTTPDTVLLEMDGEYMSAPSFDIAYEKEGYYPNQQWIKADIDHWYFFNFLIGGMIGLFVVDPITGAMWKISEEAYSTMLYPTNGLPPPPDSETKSEEKSVNTPVIPKEYEDDDEIIIFR